MVMVVPAAEGDDDHQDQRHQAPRASEHLLEEGQPGLVPVAVHLRQHPRNLGEADPGCWAEPEDKRSVSQSMFRPNFTSENCIFKKIKILFLNDVQCL